MTTTTTPPEPGRSAHLRNIAHRVWSISLDLAAIGDIDRRLLTPEEQRRVDALLAEIHLLSAPPTEDGKRISYVNGLVDDVAITGNLFRMEQMDWDAWWVCIYRGDQRTAFCLRWDRKTKNIIANVTDDGIPDGGIGEEE